MFPRHQSRLARQLPDYDGGTFQSNRIILALAAWRLKKWVLELNTTEQLSSELLHLNLSLSILMIYSLEIRSTL